MDKEHKFRIAGVEYTSRVEDKGEGRLIVYVNGKPFEVEVENPSGSTTQVVHHIVHHVGAGAPVAKPQPDVFSPMPGTITKINARPGDKVKKGDVLLVIEAMKMANDIVAEGEGTVKDVLVKIGQNVIQSDPLVTFVPVAQPAQGGGHPVAPAPAPVPQPKVNNDPGAVVAPLPGLVKQVLVTVGQEVKRGDTVVTIEAMKMENKICAEVSGKVKTVNAKPDTQVNQGDVLVEIG